MTGDDLSQKIYQTMDKHKEVNHNNNNNNNNNNNDDVQ